MADRANSSQLDQGEMLQTLLGDLDGGAARGPLFRRLARTIAAAADRGALPRGTRLPAERKLADALGVSRGTVVTAYDELVADGVVERRRGSGTFVLGAETLGLPPGREGTVLVHRLVDRSSGPSTAIDLSLSDVGDAAGLPDVELSTADLRDTFPGSGYSPLGLPDLRRAIAAHVTGWGLPTDLGQVVVTTGAQQALSAAAMCWIRPGDLVAVDDPTYPGAIAAFTQAGARLVPMGIDDGGVRPDEVARVLAQRPALVYLQSGPQSPTGQVLADQRRRVIADLIVRARVPLVEDAALADLGWSALPPPVAAWCGDAAVAVIGSFSKLYWGGLRIGFVRAPEPVAQRFARVKAAHDFGSAVIGQLLVERLLREAPDFATWRRDDLRARYDVLAAGLTEHLPEWEWTPPAGGMSLWLRLPDTDAAAFARTALRHGVAVTPQAPLSCSGTFAERLRISFSAKPEDIAEGVRRLAAAWRA